MPDRGGCVADRRLHQLAASGQLSTVIRELPEEQARPLRGAAYEIAVPLVWSRHTRPLELRRHHWACAQQLSSLTPDCADGFSHDLDAVVGALLCYRPPIGNVAGWLVRRMDNAIRDGHRKRRGELGAQQRVRVPAWLVTRLQDDAWLVELARLVLEWVGLPVSAGPAGWPLEAWAAARASHTGDWRTAGSVAAIDRDVRTVLAEMWAGRPQWYTKFVMTPLGHKTVAAVPLPDPPGDLPPVGQEHYDAGLRELADLTLAAIGERLLAGGEPSKVVVSVVSAVFLGAPATRLDLGRAPAQHDDGLAGRLEQLLTDPVRRDQFTREVLALCATD